MDSTNVVVDTNEVNLARALKGAAIAASIVAQVPAGRLTWASMYVTGKAARAMKAIGVAVYERHEPGGVQFIVTPATNWIGTDGRYYLPLFGSSFDPMVEQDYRTVSGLARMPEGWVPQD